MEQITRSKLQNFNYIKQKYKDHFSLVLGSHDYGGDVYIYIIFKSNTEEIIESGLSFGDYEEDDLIVDESLKTIDFKSVEDLESLINIISNYGIKNIIS